MELTIVIISGEAAWGWLDANGNAAEPQPPGRLAGVVPASAPAAPPALPQDPEDLAYAAATVLPLVCLIDASRVPVTWAPPRPYISPAVFQQELARAAAGSAPVVPGSRRV